jgi:hypothetical protein
MCISTKQFRSVFKMSALAVMIVFLSACSVRMIDFTAISSKNVPLDGLQRGAQRVTGTACVPVAVFPLGQADLKTAVDRAIESAGAPYNALVDGVVTYRNKSFIFGKACYEVTGTPIAVATPKSPSVRDDDQLDLVMHSSAGQPVDYTKLRTGTVERAAP